MASFTQLAPGSRVFTPSEATEVNNYIASQVSAGTTDGNLYQWQIGGESSTFTNNRMWSTVEAANGYKTLLAGFTPAIQVNVY